MKCEIKEISPVAKELFFVVDPEQVNVYWNRASQSINQKAHLKGFRPGKVPQAVLERFYAAEINQKALEKLMSEVLFETLDKNAIKPIVKPKVKSDKALAHGQAFEFSAEIEVLPEVQVKKWQDLEVTLPERPEVGETEVGEELERLRMRMASFRAIEDRNVAREGDFIDFTYTERCIGDHHDHADHDHKPQKRFIELGKNTFNAGNPEFEKALVGASVGQIIEVGPMTMTIEVIKECVKPELDDEFAKDLSDKFETLEDLKADVKEKLVESRVRQLEEDKKDGVLNALINANPIEVPAGLVQEQAQQMAVNSLSRFPKDMAVKFWEAYGKNLIENNLEMASRILKANLLLNEIAKDEKLEFDFEKMMQLVLERARLS